MEPQTRLVWYEPGCGISQISDQQWPAAAKVEVEIGAHGVFLLPMGIGREERCMRTGLESWRGSKAP